MFSKKRLRELYRKSQINNQIILSPKIDFIKNDIIIGSYVANSYKEIVLYLKSNKISIPKIISATDMVYEYDNKIVVPKVIFVPCRALDKEGNRVGSGKGYFDRYFSRVKQNIIKIGVVRSCFLHNRIEHCEHDIKMDYFLTEKEFLKL